MENKELLNEVILKYEVNTKSRKRDKVYARFVISKYLRNKGWSLCKIGEALNRDHSNIVYALKQFDNLKNEIDFKHIYSVILRDLEENELTIENPLITEVEEKVLKCENYFQMRLLQEELIKKYN
jgi:chromosomal replication initiation ATPase DnaA